MSIYPVPVKEWYDDPKSSFHSERDLLKLILKSEKCYHCKKPLKHCWRRVWVTHSITFGYGEAWCCKRCMNAKRTKPTPTKEKE